MSTSRPGSTLCIGFHRCKTTQITKHFPSRPVFRANASEISAETNKSHCLDGQYGQQHPARFAPLFLAVATLLHPLALPLSSSALTPYEEAKQLKYGPTADGSIRACPSNVNPNCVSTGSINDAYSPAWRADETSAAAAAQVLTLAVTNSVQGAELIRSVTLQSGAEYRAFAVTSLFGQDVVEFIIRPDSVTDRGWEGDKPGQLVTYRSMAGSVKYIWPIQQPLSDFGVQRKRLTQIREAVGWQLIGCELLECYQ